MTAGYERTCACDRSQKYFLLTCVIGCGGRSRGSDCVLLRLIGQNSPAPVPPNCPAGSNQKKQQNHQAAPAEPRKSPGRLRARSAHILCEFRPVPFAVPVLLGRGHKTLYPNRLIQPNGPSVSAHNPLAQNATRQSVKLFVFKGGQVTCDYLGLLADGLQRDTPRLAFPPQLFAKVPHVKRPSWGICHYKIRPKRGLRQRK